MDRGKRRFSKTMTSNVVDRQKRLENATCGRGFFRKRIKKTPRFQKYPDMWKGKNDLKTLCVDADFFENGRKKLHFQKYPDTCGRHLCLHFIKSKRLNRFVMFCRLGQFFETPAKFYLNSIQFMIIHRSICWML